MGSLGPLEIGLIFLAILLLFGAKRIPEIARGLGKGIREFKAASSDIRREITDIGNEVNRIDTPQPPAQTTAPRSPSTHSENYASQPGTPETPQD
jgi:sec-independent protein translocase protein TatA